MVENRSTIILSYLGMALVTMLWGLAWPVGKVVATNFHGASLTAAFIRFTFALPFLFLIILGVERSLSIPRELHLRVFMLGFLQVTLYNFMYLTGLIYTSSAAASLIISTNPTVTALIASRVYSDERINSTRLLGLFLAFLGVFSIFLYTPESSAKNPLLGNFIIFLGAVVWANATVFSRPVFRRISPLRYQFWATLYGWVALGLLALFEKPWTVDVSSESLWALAYLGIFAAATANVLFSLGVKVLGPTRTSVFVNFVPVFGVLFSIVLLAEEFSFIYVVAFILILSGVRLVNRKVLNPELVPPDDFR